MHSHFSFFLSCSWSCQDINIEFFRKWCILSLSHTSMNKVQHLLLKPQQSRKSDEATSIWMHKNERFFVCSFSHSRVRVFSLFFFFSNPSMYVRRCCKMKKNETFRIRTVPLLTYTYCVYTRVLFSSFSSCNWTQLARENNNRTKTASITVDILLC